MNWIHAPFAGAFIALILVFVAVEIALTGYALWHAARNRQTAWFVVLLIVHTLGILEIIYLIWFREDKNDGGSKIAPPPATPPSLPPTPPTPSSASAE